MKDTTVADRDLECFYEFIEMHMDGNKMTNLDKVIAKGWLRAFERTVREEVKKEKANEKVCVELDERRPSRTRKLPYGSFSGSCFRERG